MNVFRYFDDFFSSSYSTVTMTTLHTSFINMQLFFDLYAKRRKKMRRRYPTKITKKKKIERKKKLMRIQKQNTT